MPTYEYNCQKCNFRFEKLGKRLSESAKPDRCPKCGRPAPRVYSSDVVIIV